MPHEHESNEPGLPLPPLALVRRGDIVESVHRGACVETDASGNVLAAVGDPNVWTTLRSSAKPLQAVPLVTLRTSTTVTMTDEELAICCASHPGEPRHSALAASVLALSGFPPDDLVCGAPPGCASPLRHGCSGNHAGILLTAHLLGGPLAGYHLPDHPAQEHIRRVIADLSGTSDRSGPVLATDGCGIPTFGMPLRNMARAFAALCGPGAAWARIPRVMASNPELIGAESWIDVRLIQVTRGRIIAKTGAEGLLCLAQPGRARGAAIKIEDGSTRALGLVAIEFLVRAGWLSREEAADPRLAELRRPVYRASTGENCAAIVAAPALSA